jgi:hypothetical protein
MTVHTEKNYLEETYLSEEYLQTYVHAADGAQFEVIIDKKKAIAAQFQAQIIDFLKSNGIQATAQIDNVFPIGLQSLIKINEFPRGNGSQFTVNILDYTSSTGTEFEAFIGTISGNDFQSKIEINDFILSSGSQFITEILDKIFSIGTEFIAEIESQFPNGIQFLVNLVDKKSSTAMQFLVNIIDSLDSNGIQFQAFIDGYKNSNGVQFNSTIENIISGSGLQFNFIKEQKHSDGIQFISQVENHKKALGLELYKNTLFHQWAGYLVDEYLVGSYLVKAFNVFMPIQFSTSIIDYKKSLATQFEVVIEDKAPIGIQFLGVMNKNKPTAIQFNPLIYAHNPIGLQSQITIDKKHVTGIQFLGSIVDWLKPIGFQFESISTVKLATQFRVVLYNTNNLRILYEFPSRGTVPNNWTASTTASGDFPIENVNTDIVEQVWRGVDGALTSVQLTCDTGTPQGTYLDTLAILNHNLTTSANVVLIGSNDPLFNVVGVTINLIITKRNYVYISPELPLSGYRYWRLILSDATNPDNYLQIGTIIFGSCICMQGECFKNPINYAKKHFVDAIQTEGFTTSQNDRGIKSQVTLDFQSLNFSGGNYTNLQDIFETVRTNLKALWVPTPQYPLRYLVFGKLQELPQESHTDNGENADYVDFSITIDEAK